MRVSAHWPYRRREFLRHAGGHEYGGSGEVSAGKWRGDLQSLINMAVNWTLSKRVQKLDTRLIPTEEWRVIHISAVHLMASRHAGQCERFDPVRYAESKTPSADYGVFR